MPETIDSIQRDQQGLPNPFSREIPGQSLTSPLGQYPFENPARISSPVQAVDMFMEKLQEPNNLISLLNLLDAGVSIESIVRTITFTGFVDGMITVDVAELVNPILIIEVLALARKAGIGDARLLNSYDRPTVDTEKTLEIMQQLKPKKYKNIREKANALAEKSREEREKSRQERESTPVIEGSFMASPVVAIAPFVSETDIPTEAPPMLTEPAEQLEEEEMI